jgi:hypothetical protein
MSEPSYPADEPRDPARLETADALEPYKALAWRALSPAERLRRSWLLRSRLIDPKAAHDRKLFPTP